MARMPSARLSPGTQEAPNLPPPEVPNIPIPPNLGQQPVPNFGMRTPPLGGAICPDPVWGAGRALTLHGPSTFLGASWVLTASVEGQPAQSPGPLPPEPPIPGIVEGSIPFVEITGTALELVTPPETVSEGSTLFVDEI